MTENEGFSVVAATRVTHPFSTAGSNASCWVLENRCTSSTNSTVARPLARATFAAAITSLTSLTPALTADSSTNRRPDADAISVAMVVLPVPGGPQRMTDGAVGFGSTAPLVAAPVPPELAALSPATNL